MNPVYSVSQIVREVKAGLEGAYHDIYVEGELANVNCHSSGHCYATLKDAEAQVSFVMFRDDLRRLKFRPTDGLKIIARGRLTLFPSQGRFQLVAIGLTAKGVGDLQLAFEQLKARLEKEGLFRPERKRPIPAFPTWVGIITSRDGAALHDMLSVLKRRFASLRVLICPTKVQGEGAAADIADSIARLNRDFPEIDVLLVGRGGGSIEDLWAFNEEVVARAMAASRIPIISCVGHETDVTIADFVADLRAPTPSAAAELVIQAKSEWRARLSQAQMRLKNAFTWRVQEIEQRLDLERLQRALQQTLENARERLRHAAEKLHLLSPLATLSRGFAIARRANGQVVRSATELQPEEIVEVLLQQGRMYAEVKRTEV